MATGGAPPRWQPRGSYRQPLRQHVGCSVEASRARFLLLALGAHGLLISFALVAIILRLLVGELLCLKLGDQVRSLTTDDITPFAPQSLATLALVLRWLLGLTRLERRVELFQGEWCGLQARGDGAKRACCLRSELGFQLEILTA